MKKIYFVLCTIWLTIILGGTTTAATKIVKEPSGLPLADPYVLFENGIYYAYGTHSDNGIEVYTSSDLFIWHFAGLALNKENTTQTRWFWAPEVYHINNTYYMYYSANERLYAATAKSPLGPFVQVGKEPFLPEGSIDGTLFRDDNGNYYFFFVRFNNGNNIWVARMTENLTSLDMQTLHPCIQVSQDWEMDPKFPGCKVNEGPFVLKHNGKYFLSYSANHYQSKHYGIGIATATNIMGTWTKSPQNPILQGIGGLVGTGHHSFFVDKTGKLKMIFHAHNSLQKVDPRLSYFINARFSGNTIKCGKNIIVPTLKP